MPLKNALDTKGGFVLAHWDGTARNEKTGSKKSPKLPFVVSLLDAENEEGVCVFSGKPSSKRVLLCKSILKKIKKIQKNACRI